MQILLQNKLNPHGKNLERKEISIGHIKTESTGKKLQSTNRLSRLKTYKKTMMRKLKK